jgi:phosphoribosylglycinamide formyltransferase-1
MLTIGILASGKGSNFDALRSYIERESPPVSIGVVISDHEDAPVLEKARAAGIEHVYLPPGKHKTFLSPEAEQAYVDRLNAHRVDLVCLAGFMRVLKGTFLNAFAGRIVNIHPSLLPAFPGLESWRQAIEYGVRFTGCTVHYVNERIDGGQIILQAVVPVLPDDDDVSLHRRIQEKEHLIYPLAVRLIAESRVTVTNGRVLLL